MDFMCIFGVVVVLGFLVALITRFVISFRKYLKELDDYEILRLPDGTEIFVRKQNKQLNNT